MCPYDALMGHWSGIQRVAFVSFFTLFPQPTDSEVVRYCVVMSGPLPGHSLLVEVLNRLNSSYSPPPPRKM